MHVAAASTCLLDQEQEPLLLPSVLYSRPIIDWLLYMLWPGLLFLAIVASLNCTMMCFISFSFFPFVFSLARKYKSNNIGLRGWLVACEVFLQLICLFYSVANPKLPKASIAQPSSIVPGSRGNLLFLLIGDNDSKTPWFLDFVNSLTCRKTTKVGFSYLWISINKWRLSGLYRIKFMIKFWHWIFFTYNDYM